MTKQKFLASTVSERRTYLASRHPLSILFGYFTMFIYGMCIRSFLTNWKRHFDSLIAIVFHLAIGTLLYINGGWTAVLLTLVIPFFMTGALGSYLFYVQHNFVGVTFKGNQDWSYDYAALASSSYIKMSGLMHWFTGNIGYHHIHHINSRIPFYRLPEAMNKIPELQDVVSTSLNVHDIIACLRLKVWDTDKNKMISFSEMKLSA
jgi:omega-6 fatty acid desaturase (delta-12 desaturase)